MTEPISVLLIGGDSRFKRVLPVLLQRRGVDSVFVATSVGHAEAILSRAEGRVLVVPGSPIENLDSQDLLSRFHAALAGVIVLSWPRPHPVNRFLDRFGVTAVPPIRSPSVDRPLLELAAERILQTLDELQKEPATDDRLGHLDVVLSVIDDLLASDPSELEVPFLEDLDERLRRLRSYLAESDEAIDEVEAQQVLGWLRRFLARLEAIEHKTLRVLALITAIRGFLEIF